MRALSGFSVAWMRVRFLAASVPVDAWLLKTRHGLVRYVNYPIDKLSRRRILQFVKFSLCRFNRILSLVLSWEYLPQRGPARPITFSIDSTALMAATRPIPDLWRRDGTEIFTAQPSVAAGVISATHSRSRQRASSHRLTDTTSVTFNGTSAVFRVWSDTFLTAAVPAGVATGFVAVTTQRAL